MTETKYSILIASSCYKDDTNLPELQCPEADVDSLGDLLKTHCNFSESLVLKNRPHDEIMKQFKQILMKAGKDDLVLIYFSGHGIFDRLSRKFYLATTDTESDIPEANSVSIDFIKDVLVNSSVTKIIIILDCCFGGAAGENFTPIQKNLDNQLQNLLSDSGIYILAASTSVKPAIEKGSERWSSFTKAIIEGISSWNAANEEGNITVDTLYQHVYTQLTKEGGQTPLKRYLNVTGDLVIASMDKLTRDEKAKPKFYPKLMGYLNPDSSSVNVGEQVKWTFKIKNEGNCELYQVIAIHNREILENQFDLSMGEEHLLKFTSKYSLTGSETENVTARAITGEGKSLNVTVDATIQVNLPLEQVQERKIASEWFDKGISFDDKGLKDEALRAFNKAIEHHPQYAEAWLGKSVALSDDHEALKAIEKAIEINPQFSEAWYTRGVILRRLIRFHDAIESYNKAIELNPTYVEAWNNKANVHNRLMQYDDAIRASDKAIELDPNHTTAWLIKSQALKELGRSSEADAAFAEAKKLGYKGYGWITDLFFDVTNAIKNYKDKI